MKDSFIGKKEINEFLNIDNHGESTLFNHEQANSKTASLRHFNETNSFIERSLIKESPYRYIYFL
jgi:hypothetical protein